MNDSSIDIVSILQMATGKEDQGSAEAIIGRFGVGFYSAFMVADKIDVFSRSSVLGGGGDHGEDQGQPGNPAGQKHTCINGAASNLVWS